MAWTPKPFVLLSLEDIIQPLRIKIIMGTAWGTRYTSFSFTALDFTLVPTWLMKRRTAPIPEVQSALPKILQTQRISTHRLSGGAWGAKISSASMRALAWGIDTTEPEAKAVSSNRTPAESPDELTGISVNAAHSR
jgi:hypothetical protein